MNAELIAIDDPKFVTTTNMSNPCFLHVPITRFPKEPQLWQIDGVRILSQGGLPIGKGGWEGRRKGRRRLKRLRE